MKLFKNPVAKRTGLYCDALMFTCLLLPLCPVATASAAASTTAAFSLDRANANHKAVVNGIRQLSDLSRREREELAEFERGIERYQADKRNAKQRCIDKEIENRGGSASELELRIINLACREH